MALLSRWTLRALPVALGAVDTERNSDAKLALFCVRASIAMAVSGKFKTRETTDAILGADFDIHEVTRGVRTNAEGVPFGQEIEPVSLEVNPTIGGTHTDTTNVADFTHNALAIGDYPLWDSFGGNMASFYPDSMTFAVSEMDKGFSEIFGVGIWAGGTPFVLSLGGWGRFTMHSDQHPEWAFWREWYQGFLDGKPLNWELQKEIAEIPGADWELGPKRIAGLIEGIKWKIVLEHRIRELEDKPIISSRSRLGIGGNNPPETLEHAVQVSKELLVIWEPLIDLKTAAASERPDKSIIHNAIEALGKALKTGLKWWASKTDLAVDTTIKWGIPAAGGFFAMNPDKLAAVIEAAKAWLIHIP